VILPIIVAVVGTAVADPIVVPQRYLSATTYKLNIGDAPATFVAYTDCGSTFTNKTMYVCAELPYNPVWNPYNGYIVTEVYNNPAMVSFGTI